MPITALMISKQCGNGYVNKGPYIKIHFEIAPYLTYLNFEARLSGTQSGMVI